MVSVEVVASDGRVQKLAGIQGRWKGEDQKFRTPRKREGREYRFRKDANIGC